MAPLVAVTLVGITMSVGMPNTPVAQASGLTHTITISGPCDGTVPLATDWQSVTGLDPMGATAAQFGVGDSLTIVNDCSEQLDDPNQPWLDDMERLHLIDLVSTPVLPLLSQNPSFSDGTTQWTSGAGIGLSDYMYGRIERGESVTIVFASAATGFLLSNIIKSGMGPNNSVFTDGIPDSNPIDYGRFEVALLPRISPTSQTVSGQVGSAITATTAFTATNFSGSVSYAVTGANQLPAGLQLDATTGVISGTPTAVSTDTITITATGASSGTATTTVTFAIAAAPTTTTTTTTTVAPSSSTPTLVTSANQAALTRQPGAATMLVNGTAVTPEVVSLAESPAAQVPPTQRTAAQISQLREAAQEITQQLDTFAGGDSGVNVVNTSTGAVLTGVFEGQRVPVEDVVVVQAQQTATLFAARDSRGNIVEVQPGALLEVNSDGDVAVQAFGLPAGESVELVLMSTPTLLGSFVVGANGTVKTTADVPTSVGTGNHTLVVATPSIQASLGLKVVKPLSQLPKTGASSTLINWAVAIALSGAYLVLVSSTRRRRYQ
jgi:hypothetical protein